MRNIGLCNISMVDWKNKQVSKCFNTFAAFYVLIQDYIHMRFNVFDWRKKRRKKLYLLLIHIKVFLLLSVIFFTFFCNSQQAFSIKHVEILFYLTSHVTLNQPPYNIIFFIQLQYLLSKFCDMTHKNNADHITHFIISSCISLTKYFYATTNYKYFLWGKKLHNFFLRVKFYCWIAVSTIIIHFQFT